MERGPFARAKLGVAAGMAGGLVITLAALLWPGLPSGPRDAANRLALWLACDLAAAFWLAAAVALLARHRFFSAEDIDGGGLTAGTQRAQLLQSLIQNTLEQSVLAMAAWGAWLLLTGGSAAVAVLCAGCFFIGRLLFFVGYGRGAAARALGFALTFYPSIGLILAAAVPAVRRFTSVFAG